MDQNPEDSASAGSEALPPVDKQILAPSEGPREHLISTAIKFLQNAKVASSPLYQKKAFLEKKGLTPEEISLAVERSGVTEVNPGAVTAVQGPPPGYQPGVMGGAQAMVGPVVAPIPPQSRWARLRDLTFTSVIIVGVSYAAYHAFQKYLRPYFLGQNEQEKRLERLEGQVLEIQKSVSDSLSELNKTLAAIQTSLQNQQIQMLAPNNDRDKGTADIRSDIASLKGLLLNRNQFPPAPSVSPVLPAWQRAQPSPPVSSSAPALTQPSAAAATVAPPVVQSQSSATSLTSQVDEASVTAEENADAEQLAETTGVSEDADVVAATSSGGLQEDGDNANENSSHHVDSDSF